MIAVTSPRTFNPDNEPPLSLEEVSFAWPCGNKALNKCSFYLQRPGLWMLVGKNGNRDRI